MSETISNTVAESKWNESTETVESRSRLPVIAHALLLLLGVMALVFTSVSVSNYVTSAQSRHELQLEMTDLQIIDDDDPRAIIHQKLRNLSPLPMQVERYSFFLYLNDEFVGTSYSVYVGTDPDRDPLFYREGRTIQQTLDPQSNLDLDFTLFIYPVQMDVIRQAQDSGGTMTWSIRSDFRVYLPYTHDDNMVRLYATLEEVRDGS